MRLVDAHTHISLSQSQTATALADRGLWQLVAASSPTQWTHVWALARTSPRIIPTCGWHPWVADTFDPAILEPCFRQAPIIGEIGLDKVWTEVPLVQQRAAFIYQLERAVEMGKPVVLHTKGAESEILQELRRLRPSKVIVHWYSGDAQLLPAYSQLGCYFTLGPDVHANPAVQAVCRQVPLDKLLTETDGIEAVEWARGQSCTMEDVPAVLLRIIATAAALRGLPPAQMQEQIHANFLAFLGVV